MSNPVFENASLIQLKVKWANGQPKLTTKSNADPANKKLNKSNLVADLMDEDDVSKETSMTLQLQKSSDFVSLAVADTDGSPAWSADKKLFTLHSGEENLEVAFTVTVTTKKTAAGNPSGGWVPTGPDQEGLTTWKLDPYVRLQRSNYTIKPPSTKSGS